MRIKLFGRKRAPSVIWGSLSPFGDNYTMKESKGGGVNKPGRFGGVYEDPYGDKSLFKQDQTKGKKTEDDRPRIGKVLGEAIVGSIVRSLYPKMVVKQPASPQDNARIEQARNLVAEVNLVRAAVDESTGNPDNNLYIQSVFLKKYQGDLWVLAYRDHFKNETNNQYLAANNEAKQRAFLDSIDKYLRRRQMMLGNMINGLEKKIKKVEKENNPDLLADLKAQQASHQGDLNALMAYPKDEIAKVLREGSDKARTELFTFIAKVKTKAMKRPSAVFRQTPRKIVSQYLMANPDVMKEFCDQMAVRLLFGDRGVHNANFGISTDIQGKLHCCSLDYGTGFFNLTGDLDLYDLLSSGLKTHKVYKYHFREYPGVIYTDAMAEGFIKAGTIGTQDITNAIKDSIAKLRDKNLNVASIKKICALAGMKSREYAQLKTSKTMLDALEAYTLKQIPLRQKVFSERGYCLLLENCIENGNINLTKLKAHLKTYPELSKFALSKFKKMKLTKSSGIESTLPVPGVRDAIGEWIIKNKLIQAVVEHMPTAERIPEYQKMINYYQGRSQQACYAVEATAELNMIKQACDELHKRLTEVQDITPNDPRLAEAFQALGEVQTLIANNPNGLTQSSGVAYYGVEAEVFEGKNREAEVQAKVQEYLQRPDAGAPQPLEMNQEDRSYKPKLSAPIADPVYARVIHSQLDDGKKTFEVAAVQRKLDDGSFKQEIHVEDPKKINKLSAEAYRVWGLIEAKNFLATTPDKKNGITLKGNWPKKLKRTVVAYCAILQAEQQAAKEAALARGERFDKEVNYNCYDGATRKKLVVEKSEIKYLQERLNRPDDRLALAIKNVEIPEVKMINQFRNKK